MSEFWLCRNFILKFFLAALISTLGTSCITSSGIGSRCVYDKQAIYSVWNDEASYIIYTNISAGQGGTISSPIFSNFQYKEEITLTSGEHEKVTSYVLSTDSLMHHGQTYIFEDGQVFIGKKTPDSFELYQVPIQIDQSAWKADDYGYIPELAAVEEVSKFYELMEAGTVECLDLE